MSRKAKAPFASALPAPGEGKRGPEGYLAYLVRQASVALRGALDRALGDFNATAPQFSVLTMIAAYPGVSGAELARLTFLTPQTINVIVRNLERDGIIGKTTHATHGRILRLTATTKGHALLKRCHAHVAEVDAELRGLLSRDEERIVRRWLSAVAGKLGELR
jgi:DNA-binding MarR family transcriptional regulator